MREKKKKKKKKKEQKNTNANANALIGPKRTLNPCVISGLHLL